MLASAWSPLAYPWNRTSPAEDAGLSLSTPGPSLESHKPCWRCWPQLEYPCPSLESHKPCWRCWPQVDHPWPIPGIVQAVCCWQSPWHTRKLKFHNLLRIGQRNYFFKAFFAAELGKLLPYMANSLWAASALYNMLQWRTVTRQQWRTVSKLSNVTWLRIY